MPGFQRSCTPAQDATVDEAQPDTNLGDDADLHVRSEEAADRRTWLRFDLNDVMPAEFFTDEVLEAKIRANPEAVTNGRSIEAVWQDLDWDESSITWNNQPDPDTGVLQDTHDDGGTTPHEWDVTEAVKNVLEEGDPGLIGFVVLDATEDETHPRQQTYASKEAADGPAFELIVEQTLSGFFDPKKDTYVDEADPDANFADAADLYIRTEEGANRRTILELPLDVIPAEARSIDRVRVTLNPSSTSIDRTLEARAPDQDADLATVTWNDQPSRGDVLATETSNDDPHRWDSDEEGSAALLEHADGRFADGDDVFQLVLLDETEGSTLGLSQVYDSLESSGSDGRVQFWISDFARTGDLGSQLVAAHASDLSTTIEPIPVEDLPTTVLPWNDGLPTLTSVVGVRAVPIEDDHMGRALGRVSIELEGVLADVEAVFSEAASIVEVGDDEEDAVVQLVDEADAEFPTDRAGDPARLSRGDARLFALGDGSTFEPGDVVTWQGLEFRVAGVLDEEHVTDEAMFRELGLRLLATTHEARAIGTVSTS